MRYILCPCFAVYTRSTLSKDTFMQGTVYFRNLIGKQYSKYKLPNVSYGYTFISFIHIIHVEHSYLTRLEGFIMLVLKGTKFNKP